MVFKEKFILTFFTIFQNYLFLFINFWYKINISNCELSIFTFIKDKQSVKEDLEKCLKDMIRINKDKMMW